MLQSKPSLISTLSHYHIIFLAFSFALSPAISNITLVLLLLLFVVGGDYKSKFKRIFSNPISWIIFTFLALHLVSLTYTSDPIAGRYVIQYMLPFFLSPFLFGLIEARTVKPALYAFIASMIVSTFASYGVMLHLLNTLHDGSKALFLDRVIHTPLLAFATFLLLVFIRNEARSSSIRVLGFSLALLMALNVFLTDGRAGQVALLFLLVAYVIIIFKTKLVYIFGSLIVLFSTLVILYFTVDDFNDRVHVTSETIKDINGSQETGLGIRLNTAINSYYIIRQHPLFGSGVGSFKNENIKVSQTIRPHVNPISQPHNFYIYTLVQFGMVGLLLFLLLFIVMLRFAFNTHDSYKTVRILFIFIFMLIMFSDSYLVAFSSQMLFVLMTLTLFTISNSKKPLHRKEDSHDFNTKI